MNERGLTSSIMDYARFNYVAQPGDKGVKLIPPSLGIYDRYAIEWLYKPVDAEDMWEESRIAGALIDSHAGDPWYRFGAQQSASALVQYDPTARTQDLGDDPIRAGNYAVSNLKYILPNIKDWIEDDPDFSHRSQLYTQLCSQYGRYLNNVLALIGGVVLTKVKDGTPGSPCVPVPAARQREALRWVLDEVRSSGWLDEPDLTSHFGLHSPESNKIASTVGLSLASAAPLAVSTAVANGSAYSLEEYFDDLFSMLFHSGRLTSQEKTLQRSIVSGMSRAAAPQPAKPASLDDGEFCFGEAISPTQSPVDVSAVNETAGYRLQFLRKVAKMAGKRRSSARPGERAHYEYLYETARKALL